VIKKVFSSALIYALAPQLPKILSVMMMPIITKYLTPDDYGVTGIIMAYMAAFESFRDLGLRVVLTNSFFKFPAKFTWVWRRIHGFIQLWAIVYGLLLSLLLNFILPNQIEEDYWKIFMIVVVPIMFFEPVSSIGRDFFQLSKKPLPMSIISVFSGFITVISNYYFIVYQNLGYLGLLSGIFFSGFFSMLVYAYLVYFKNGLTPIWNFTPKWILSKLKISFPTIPHYYAGYIINLSDRVLLDLYKVPLKEIGLYSFAYSLGSYFSIIGRSFLQASGPYYMEFFKKNNREGELEAQKLSNLVQVFFLILAVIYGIWATEIFQLFAKNVELQSSYLISIFIIFSYTYYPSYAFISLKIWSSENTKRILKISVGSAIVSILINLVLIPFFGIWAAVISTLLSMLYMGYSGYFYNDISGLYKISLDKWIWPTVTVFLLIFIVFLDFLNLGIGIKLLFSFISILVGLFTIAIILKYKLNFLSLKIKK
jgi:O-antigen/teichoic acid export membrane protein